MALGTMVLGGLIAGPAVLVGGWVLAAKGEKVLTKAHAYRADANRKVAELHSQRSLLDSVVRRIGELKWLVTKLDKRAAAALDELEGRPFDMASDSDVAKLSGAMQLTKALVDIMRTPVLDADGQLTSGSAQIQVKYRALAQG